MFLLYPLVEIYYTKFLMSGPRPLRIPPLLLCHKSELHGNYKVSKIALRDITVVFTVDKVSYAILKTL